MVYALVRKSTKKGVILWKRNGQRC